MLPDLFLCGQLLPTAGTGLSLSLLLSWPALSVGVSAIAHAATCCWSACRRLHCADGQRFHVCPGFDQQDATYAGIAIGRLI